jgi:tRNA-dihydrouridine synthase A
MSAIPSQPRHRFCIAPMMDWTDRHCRAFHRVLSGKALLYTEMVTAAAVIHGERERLIGFDDVERPLALQLGGADASELAEAARIGEDFGYDEINLNCGCPSDRVQSGCFGAALMGEPVKVAACVATMQKAVSVPVTVKCRIGIDDRDSEAEFRQFIDTVADAGCRTFIVHARKAWLSGLSPKQNREIPPLDYGRVYRLKTARPDLHIVINGGIASLDEAEGHLAHVDGLMLGRAAYQTPWIVGDADRRLFATANPVASRAEAIAAFMPYVEAQLAQGIYLSRLTRHILGLYCGEPGGRLWRRHLSQNAHRPGAGPEVIADALALVEGTRARKAA